MKLEHTKGMLQNLGHIVQKKNLLFLIGLVGIGLIFLSDVLFQKKEKSPAEQTTTTAVSTEAYTEGLEQRLAEMIASVQGAGKATVMITLETAGETVYAQEEKTQQQTQSGTDGTINRSSSYESSHTILDAGSTQQPLVETQLPPEIRGVAVVCEGGDEIAVVSRITSLVSVVLGVSTNRICVTKMI